MPGCIPESIWNARGVSFLEPDALRPADSHRDPDFQKGLYGTQKAGSSMTRIVDYRHLWSLYP
jgi:hypothetical protein